MLQVHHCLLMNQAAAEQFTFTELLTPRGDQKAESENGITIKVTSEAPEH